METPKDEKSCAHAILGAPASRRLFLSIVTNVANIEDFEATAAIISFKRACETPALPGWRPRDSRGSPHPHVYRFFAAFFFHINLSGLLIDRCPKL
jgi:hypothetical protein